MNSWTSTFEFACAPPLRIFIRGTGMEELPSERCCHIFPVPTVALRQAIEAPSIALAPILLLLGVESIVIIAVSTTPCSLASNPTKASAMGPLTFATARSTPLPPQRLSPSLSSTASCRPVLAPDGTIARPSVPSSVRQSTSTVGLPRESNTILPRIRDMRVPMCRGLVDVF